MEQENPLIDELLAGVELEDDTFSGAASYVGSYPDAVLEDVSERDRNEYGFSLKLKFDLAGIGGGRTFNTVVFLPGGANGSEKANTINEMSKNRLASIMHAGALLPTGKKWSDVTTDENYAKLVALFRSGIGRVFGLKINARKNDPQRVDVWGLRTKGA